MLPHGRGTVLIWPKLGVMGANLPDQVTNIATGKIDIRDGTILAQWTALGQVAPPHYIEVEPTQDGVHRNILVYDAEGLGEIRTVWVVERLQQVDDREPENDGPRKRAEARQEERRLSPLRPLGPYEGPSRAVRMSWKSCGLERSTALSFECCPLVMSIVLT